MSTASNTETESGSTAKPVVAKPISPALLRETVQTLFEQIDMDDNGIIDNDELQNLAGLDPCFMPSDPHLSSLSDSISFNDLDEASAKEVVQSMDVNGDGKIDFADFLAWYTRYTASAEESGASATLFRLLRRCAGL
jgi:Ca2+-binding EF-hand superfamily protein